MPKFNRVSLVGSEELFRPTKVDPDPEPVAAPPAPADATPTRRPEPALPSVPHPAPLSRERQSYRVNLTEPQVKLLIEAVQRMKYPGQVHENKPSIESYEALEDLRNHLWDAIS